LAKSDVVGISAKRRCELLGVVRSTLYYHRRKRKDRLRRLNAADKEARMAEIDKIHTAMPATGARKMARMLTAKELTTSRYEAAELMRQMNICAIYPKPNLSKPAKSHPHFPYLLKNKRIFCANQVWAIDITYIPYKGGHMYLTAIIDWYSRMIVGWRLADSLDLSPVLACVSEAFDAYGVPAILNSDQGAHFTAAAYSTLLVDHGVEQSMDGKARWVDNVIIERWFRTLKYEWVYINDYDSPRELRAGIAGFIKDYNALRLHASLDYKTPAETWDSSFAQAA